MLACGVCLRNLTKNNASPTRASLSTHPIRRVPFRLLNSQVRSVGSPQRARLRPKREGRAKGQATRARIQYSYVQLVKLCISSQNSVNVRGNVSVMCRKSFKKLGTRRKESKIKYHNCTSRALFVSARYTDPTWRPDLRIEQPYCAPNLPSNSLAYIASV